MAEDKKYYLDQDGLGLYDENIKEYIADELSEVMDDVNTTANQFFEVIQEFVEFNDNTVLLEAKSYTDSVANSKAEKATTLAGYEIIDAYTKGEVNTKIAETENYVDEKISDVNDYVDGVANSALTMVQQLDANVLSEAKEYADGIADDKVPTSRKVNGKELSTDITLSASDVGLGNVNNTSDTDKPVSTAQKEAIDDAKTDAEATAKLYTDSEIAKLINASDDGVLNSITELATAIEENDDAIAALNTIASGKADASHTHDDRYYTETEIDGKISTLNTAINGKAASSHSHAISDVTNLQTTLDGKAASSHTHNYAGSSSAGGAATTALACTGNSATATTATKVGSSLTVKLNSGTTEGTNMFTFNGSAAKSINITPSAIGAAASSHTHDDRYYTESEIDSKVSTLNTAINGKAAKSTTLSGYGITDAYTKTQVDSIASGKANSSHTHNYAGSSSAGGSATSAVKLDTSTAGSSAIPVYFTGGKPAQVSSVAESYLSWGGKALSGTVSPVDAASSYVHSANRFQFAKPAGIAVSYTTNGSTWVDYGASDADKINLVSGVGANFMIGKRNAAGTNTVNDKVKIVLHATNMGVYTRLQKLLINITTNYASGSYVLVEKSMKGSETTFTTVGTYSISGWSGWNSIPIGAAFGGGSTQTSNISAISLTFGITGVNSSQNSALTVLDIVGIGDTYWAIPSNMAKTGHLYSWNSSQDAVFPATVVATSFSGSLSGNATTATTATKVGSSDVGGTTTPIYLKAGVPTACTYTLGASVPSGAKFTDTVYTHPSYTAKSSGLYKITVDGSGHVSAATAVAKSDITGLGIPAQDTVYTHPTTSGNKHIPSGGSSGQFLKWSSDGTATWAADNNTTYTFATGDSNGQIKVTPSGGSAQNISVKGLGTAAYTASTAYATAAQGTLASNAMPKSGGTFTGAVKFNSSPTTAHNSFYNSYDKSNSSTTVCLIGTTEGSIYIGSYNYPCSNKEVVIASGFNLRPAGTQTLGTSSNKWSNVYATTFTGALSGNATSATKVGSNLIIKLNSGTTEGTNLFTFNGSGAKTVNITPSAIGAAASSHMHNSLYHTSTGVQSVTIGVSGDSYYFRPTTDTNGLIYLGSSNNKWKQLYATTTTINTSDRTQKREIKDLDDRYIKLFDLIRPTSYYLANGDRVHTGFIAQEVEEAMKQVGLTAEELGFFCRDVKVITDDKTGESTEVHDENGNPVYVYGLRYSEYIAIMAEKVKRLESKYNEKLEELEKRLKALEA